MMLTKISSTQIEENSPSPDHPEDQGTLLENSENIVDDFKLTFRFVCLQFLFSQLKRVDFRHRSRQTRSTRCCLCGIFFVALLTSLALVLLSTLFFRSSDEETVWFDHIEIEPLWTSAFPKLITESAFRLVDCNSDGILDVIFGFGTGVDSLDDNPILCDLYFNGVHPCNGGVKVMKNHSYRTFSYSLNFNFRR